MCNEAKPKRNQSSKLSRIINRLRSTSIQLSLKYGLLYGILAIVTFYTSFKIAEYELNDWIIDRMQSDSDALQSVYETRGLDDLLARLDTLSEINFESNRIYLLLDDSGQTLAGNFRSLNRGKAQYVLTIDDIYFDTAPNPESMEYQILETKIGPYELIQGTSHHLESEILEALIIALIIGILLILITGLAVGILVGRTTERRINRIEQSLEQVAAGNLSERVTLSKSHQSQDDLTRVSKHINQALDYLERLVMSQKQITADIAHDLRTPLQKLRQRLEHHNSILDSAPMNRNDIEAMLTQTDDIIETFQALLRIAQIEGSSRNTKIDRFTSIDLTLLMNDVIEAYDAVAEESGHTINATISESVASIQGDRQLLAQMLTNLIENAIRHTKAKTAIDIQLIQNKRNVIIEIGDSGLGISAEEREKVFERFYRLEKSRTTPGHGLGLSLVKAIVDYHHADVELLDNHPGLKVRITF